MAPGWYGPPNAHAMRQQQAPPQGGGARFHAQGGPPPPPAGPGMNPSGVPPPSPHQNYHHRGSPPMRGAYHPPGPPRGPPPPPRGMPGHGHPHGPRMGQGSGRFPPAQPHHQGMLMGGPPPPQMPPNAGGGHPMGRHHAPSPAMARRMPLPPPPPNAMRPVPHQGHPAAAMQQQHGSSQQAAAAHHTNMMRYQQDQQHQHQQMQQRQMHTNGNGGSEDENRAMQQQLPPPHTPDQREAMLNHGESPSPPPVPPHLQEHQQHQEQHHLAGEGVAGPSPASLPDSEGGALGEHHDQQQQQAKTPSSWNAGPGMGPLRESRLQNMPQMHLHHQMQPHNPHAQRPLPQHPNAMNHHHHHHHAFVNENMQRFQAMQHHPKPIGMAHQQHQQAHHHHQQQHMARAHAMFSPAQQHQHAEAQAQAQLQAQQQQQGQQKKQGGKKVGPDGTMDAASVLLALRTSASPATVSQATLEEQQSKDQADDTSKTVPMTVSESQDKEDHDDDVPELQSSSSSMSAPKFCAAVHEEEEQHHEVPKNFPTRLALPNDEAKLNSLHCFLRSELLEIFVVERSQNKSPTHSPGSSVGRVGLRCVFCAMARKRNQISTTDDSVSTPQQHRCDEAPMAVFYPKSIAEIYRLVTSWQRCHLRKCRNLPPNIRNKWVLLRENDKSRGKTHYWITSAKEIGLVDCQSRAGGIRFATPRTADAADSAVNTNRSLDDDDETAQKSMYQPYNIPVFKEGPSQKQREASAMDVTANPASSDVESPLKENTDNKVKPAAPSNNTTERDNETIVAAASATNSTQPVATVVGL